MPLRFVSAANVNQVTITAASEVMASLCLAEGPDDLRERLDRILLAYTYKGEPVTAGSLKATGAMLALLRDALMPNLVHTGEGVLGSFGIL